MKPVRLVVLVINFIKRVVYLLCMHSGLSCVFYTISIDHSPFMTNVSLLKIAPNFDLPCVPPQRKLLVVQENDDIDLR